MMGYRRLVFPLIVVGMNSIFIYCVRTLFNDDTYSVLSVMVGTFTRGFTFIGTFAPVAQAFVVFMVMWYLCYWLYQRKIFIRI